LCSASAVISSFAHVVGVVDPLVPRLTLARSEDPAIVEGGD